MEVYSAEGNINGPIKPTPVGLPEYNDIIEAAVYNQMKLGYKNSGNGELSLDMLRNFFIENKRMLAAEYKIFFNGSVIKFRTETPNTRANYWLMCVELENRKERDLFLAETNAKKVMTRPIWQLMYRLPMYHHCQRDKQLNAQFLEERIVNIPSSVR